MDRRQFLAGVLVASLVPLAPTVVIGYTPFIPIDVGGITVSRSQWVGLDEAVFRATICEYQVKLLRHLVLKGVSTDGRPY